MIAITTMKSVEAREEESTPDRVAVFPPTEDCEAFKSLKITFWLDK